jgi:hypothetical protein
MPSLTPDDTTRDLRGRVFAIIDDDGRRIGGIVHKPARRTKLFHFDECWYVHDAGTGVPVDTAPSYPTAEAAIEYVLAVRRFAPELQRDETGLQKRDRDILALEAETFATPGEKQLAIWTRLRMRPTAYYQRLYWLREAQSTAAASAV